ncbi:hypothetical protein MTR67_040194 [Solanum verrucosum]|uniref:Reverse transcriptase n=1 Tax=Solanum verrucosum TaxID=315347 RepID=A0AAF0UJ39_SOLVR|nr:hypothetical protein MTR67_040194 [Solanum verrucosum]
MQMVANPEGISDHCPLKLAKEGRPNMPKRAFKFCNVWAKHPKFMDIVQRGWKIQEEDRMALAEVQKWLHQNPSDIALQEQEKQKCQRFRKSSYLAEAFLQQRSKANWIKLGDDNTRYFYSIINHKRLQLATNQIRDKEGKMQTENTSIAKMFVEYYEELLGKKERYRIKVFCSFLKNGHMLTIPQQLELIRSYVEKKVKQAMFSIDVNKSLGPNGYGSGFFRDDWSVVGEGVIQAVLEFLESGKLLRQINATIIALIPKIAVPEYASQFRPISCCNVIYRKTSAICLMNIDLRKAYDIVSWDFIKEALRGFGFPETFTRMVMVLKN